MISFGPAHIAYMEFVQAISIGGMDYQHAMLATALALDVRFEGAIGRPFRMHEVSVLIRDGGLIRERALLLLDPDKGEPLIPTIVLTPNPNWINVQIFVDAGALSCSVPFLTS